MSENPELESRYLIRIRYYRIVRFVRHIGAASPEPENQVRRSADLSGVFPKPRARSTSVMSRTHDRSGLDFSDRDTRSGPGRGSGRSDPHRVDPKPNRPDPLGALGNSL